MNIEDIWSLLIVVDNGMAVSPDKHPLHLILGSAQHRYSSF